MQALIPNPSFANVPTQLSHLLIIQAASSASIYARNPAIDTAARWLCNKARTPKDPLFSSFCCHHVVCFQWRYGDASAQGPVSNHGGVRALQAQKETSSGAPSLRILSANWKYVKPRLVSMSPKGKATIHATAVCRTLRESHSDRWIRSRLLRTKKELTSTGLSFLPTNDSGSGG